MALAPPRPLSVPRLALGSSRFVPKVLPACLLSPAGTPVLPPHQSHIALHAIPYTGPTRTRNPDMEPVRVLGMVAYRPVSLGARIFSSV
jgi:hypothetical protein